MSQNLTPCRTMPPPNTKTKANTSHSTRQPASGTHQFPSHSRPPTCCMHVHQQQSQTCRPGELLALSEVKHPHKDRTSVSRSPSTKQEVLSQFSGYSEEIGHFTRDPCKPHLKSGLQSTKHASKKQEVNTHTDWEHSYRMEHAEHFPAPMEMCNPTDGNFQTKTRSRLNPKWKRHNSHIQLSNSNASSHLPESISQVYISRIVFPTKSTDC